MKLAIPNESGFMGRPTLSGRYLVAQSSDMSEYPSMLEQLMFLKDHAGAETVQWLEEDK